MGKSYDAFEATEMISRLLTPRPFSLSDNIKIDIHADTPGVMQHYFKNMLALYAMVPNIFLRTNDYGFHAQCDAEGHTTLSYLTKDNTDPMMQTFIGLWEEELQICIENSDTQAKWDAKTNSFTFYDCESLLEAIEMTRTEMDEISKNFSTIMVSTANSIYSDLIGRGPENTDEFHNPTESHWAVTKAIKTIISVFDHTMDFEVIPTLFEDEEVCRITLGSETPISYEKRFRDLHDVYDLFDAVCRDNSGLEIVVSPDQTELCFLINDTEKASRTLSWLYDELDIHNKALQNKAFIFINPAELQAVCKQPSYKALRLQAYQH